AGSARLQVGSDHPHEQTPPWHSTPSMWADPPSPQIRSHSGTHGEERSYHP
ncbi:hypothetical protein A2U01_0096327, partial [Trifolium medium]|nr:hypothetical protein [Trifolium medium]